MHLKSEGKNHKICRESNPAKNAICILEQLAIEAKKYKVYSDQIDDALSRIYHSLVDIGAEHINDFLNKEGYGKGSWHGAIEDFYNRAVAGTEATKYLEGGIPPMLVKENKLFPEETFNVRLNPLRHMPKIKITKAMDIVQYLKSMEDYDREVVKLMHMDSKNRVIGLETISIGAINYSIFTPRETLKGAILNNSVSVILVHNHPSGDCSGSDEDSKAYATLSTAFELLGIKLLDHIIIGKECYYSIVDGIKVKA